MGGRCVSERLERMLAEALKDRRPVLVNPTEDDIRRKAEELREEGRLICTACRKPIQDEDFRTRRVSFGPRLEAIAHLHPDCEPHFDTGLEGTEA
jgi:hypothetical protein